MRVTRAWRTMSFSLKRATAAPSTPCRDVERPGRGPRPGRPAGRSGLGSPVTTMRESSPSRVRNIFICDGVVFCASSRMTKARARGAPAHEGERRHLDRALFHELQGLVAHHLEQRVVERAQIGIDLLLQVAGQGSPAVRPLPAPGATGSAARRGARREDARHRPPPDRSCPCRRDRCRTPAGEYASNRDRQAGPAVRARVVRDAQVFERRRAEIPAGSRFHRALEGKMDLGVDVGRGSPPRPLRALHRARARPRRPGSRDSDEPSTATRLPRVATRTPSFCSRPREVLLMRTCEGGQQSVVGEFQRHLLARRLLLWLRAHGVRTPLRLFGCASMILTSRISPISAPAPSTWTGCR